MTFSDILKDAQKNLENNPPKTPAELLQDVLKQAKREGIAGAKADAKAKADTLRAKALNRRLRLIRKLGLGRWAIKLKGKRHQFRIWRKKAFEIEFEGTHEEAQCVANHLDWTGPGQILDPVEGEEE